MTYRDDRDALRERIELLEKKAASAVSPEELAAMQAELEAAKGRIDAEREALEALLQRLGAPPRPRRRARLLAIIALAGVVVGAGAAVGMVAFRWDAAAYEGAPLAVRAQPARREIDVEMARLLPDLDGCLPEGRSARIQLEMTFEGRDGAPREITTINVSERDSYPMSTVECLRSVASIVSVPPFRTPRYRYHLTLEWSDGRLQTPPLWERHGLVRDPRER